MSYQAVAPQQVAPQRVVTSSVTLELRTQVSQLGPGSIIYTDPYSANRFVNEAPQCVRLSQPIAPGAYVVVYAASGCYGPYNPYPYSAQKRH